MLVQFGAITLGMFDDSPLPAPKPFCAALVLALLVIGARVGDCGGTAEREGESVGEEGDGEDGGGGELGHADAPSGIGRRGHMMPAHDFSAPTGQTQP